MNADATGIGGGTLEAWLAGERKVAAAALLRAISASDLTMRRHGFGQTIVPRPGSVLASPVIAHYDPDPDYFFHWSRDSAIVMDALLGLDEVAPGLRAQRFSEFVAFTTMLHAQDGAAVVGGRDIRAGVHPDYLRYVRSAEELAAIRGEAVLGEGRYNPDGTLDTIRWSRPQHDGPALRALALLRWLGSGLPLDPAARSAAEALVRGDLGFLARHAAEASVGVWEEECGRDYFTEAVQWAALADGAGFLRVRGDPALASRCANCAGDLGLALDALWSERRQHYLSRRDGWPDRPDKELDAAVILAVIHARRQSGPHSVLDPRVQATLLAIETLFDRIYPVNHGRPRETAPALGRYAGDVYYSGGAFYFVTLAAAEFYFLLARRLGEGGSLPVTEVNHAFCEALAGQARGPREIALAALAKGDRFLATVRRFTPADGALSEQFDQRTGAQTSARHLTWSYAAFVTAEAARRAGVAALQTRRAG